MSTTEDPLELYDDLVMRGEAPNPESFAAEYPQHPSLLQRIRALNRVRRELDLALGAPEQDSLSPPRTIGTFTLGEPLGEGGMGRVFAATGADGTSCAVKLLHYNSTTSLERFRREASLAERLSHPGLARVIAHGVEQGVGYLVTERIAGQTLHALLKERPMAEDIPGCIRLATAIADALGHAHEQGVIHRDIKPANIIVTPSGAPVIIDFGLALERGERARLTKTGVFVGSHPYAAPEQLKGDKDAMGPWTDTFALCATLFEMLTTKKPFPEESYAQRLQSLEHLPERSPRAHNPRVPRALSKMVMQGLHPKHKKRHPHGSALAAALRRL